MSRQPTASDILEEAVNLLRRAPAAALVAYLIGAVPFIVALLFFLNDMLHSPFAAAQALTGSLALAALFVWKNVWQAIFAARLFQTLSPGAARSGRLWRLVWMEAALQPVNLLLPLPFPWAVAFFRNVSLFAALGVADPLRSAARQAVLWTRQNWTILFFITIAALVIFLNALVAIIVLPGLTRSFLGIEGEFARAGNHIFNAGTIAAAAALAWLAIDPLLDAVYVLRCFYGESIKTGEDLRAALRRAVAALVLLIAIFPAARAQTGSIDPAQLGRSIDQVVHRREFTWRAPQAAGPEPEGRWVGWVRAAGDLAHRGWDYLKRVIEEWLRQNPQKEAPGKGSPVTRHMLETLIALVIALIVGAAVTFYLRRRKPAVAAKPVAAATPAIDLTDHSLTSDRMPEAGWQELASEWMAKGELRLAMRALYLAKLSFLAGRGLVSIRSSKSGLEYRRELERRARSKPEISALFAENNAQFEAVWYGFHQTDVEAVSEFSEALTRMKASLE